MSYPVITSISTSVSGNRIDFIVNIDITNATESATVGIQYSVPDSEVYNDASYSHYTNEGNYYSYYFYADNVDTGYWSTAYAYLEVNSVIVESLTHNFYVAPIATILSFTPTVYQNTVSFELVVQYSKSVNPSYYEPKILLDLVTSEYYNYIAALEQTSTNLDNVYTYILGFAGLIYNETFKCEAQVIDESTLDIVDYQIGDTFTTPEDTSKIINVKFRPKTTKATVEVETTLNYSNNAYKVKIIYDRKEITEESKFVETEMHTTLENNNELFKLIIKRLKEKTKYNCIVELYNMSVTMIEGGQLIYKMEGLNFKTLDGFKLWMYLWYKI